MIWCLLYWMRFVLLILFEKKNGMHILGSKRETLVLKEKPIKFWKEEKNLKSIYNHSLIEFLSKIQNEPNWMIGEWAQYSFLFNLLWFSFIHLKVWKFLYYSYFRQNISSFYWVSTGCVYVRESNRAAITLKFNI